MSRPAAIRSTDIMPFRSLYGITIVHGIDVSSQTNNPSNRSTKQGRKTDIKRRRR